jgi:hypothetical protein
MAPTRICMTFFISDPSTSYLVIDEDLIYNETIIKKTKFLFSI